MRANFTIKAICRRAGIHFHATLLKPLGAWVEDRISTLSLGSVADYFAWLGDATHLKEERPGLSRVTSSRETFFLRDHGQIDVLRQHVLPELVAARAPQKILRLWSIGCSTGEEVYTLAILAETSGLLGPDWHLEITGFDIDPEALHYARQGVYRDWSFRGCPAEFRLRHFNHTADGWKINDRLRSRVSFQTLDLLSPAPQAAMADLILCRNVFIYFDRAAIDQSLTYLTRHLAEGGYLFCAPGELAAHPRTDLSVCAYPEAVVYRKGVGAKTIQMPPPVDMVQPPTLQTATVPPQMTRPRKNAALSEAAVHEAAPTVEALLERAWHAANRGLLDEAADLCARVREAKPLDPEAYYLSAILALAGGATDVARGELRRVLYLAPDFLLAYPMLAELYLTAEDHPAAERYCRQGLARAQVLPSAQRISVFATGTTGEIKAHLDQLMTALTVH